jgi:hypothetical protein
VNSATASAWPVERAIAIAFSADAIASSPDQATVLSMLKQAIVSSIACNSSAATPGGSLLPPG